MKIDLRDRVIVITGASSGIGAATAICAANAGMDVVIAARRDDRLASVATAVERTGRRCLPMRCDVRCDEDVQQLVDQTIQKLGRLDVMFANAGHGLKLSVMDTPIAKMREIFETNFYGTIRCVHLAVEAMRRMARDRHEAASRLSSAGSSGYVGHILICSSVVSEIGLPLAGAYCATKAAQDAIASALRAELASEGIYVTSVHPSTTRTEFIAQSRAHAAPEVTPEVTPEVVPEIPSKVDTEVLSTSLDKLPNQGRVFVQSPQQVAAAMVRCLKRPRPEVWPMTGTKLAMALCTAWPTLASWAMRRVIW